MAEPPYYLAVVEKQAGHYQQAAALLRTVVKLQPRNVMALHLLGQSLEHESQTRAKSRTRVADSGSHRGLEAGGGHRPRLQPGAVEPGARHEAVGSGRGRAPEGPLWRGAKEAPHRRPGRYPRQ